MTRSRAEQVTTAHKLFVSEVGGEVVVEMVTDAQPQRRLRVPLSPDDALEVASLLAGAAGGRVAAGGPPPEPEPTDMDGTFIVRDPGSGIVYSVADGAVATTPDCRCWDLVDGRWVENAPWRR